MDISKQLMRACLLVIISLILDVYSIEVCFTVGTTIYYCDPGYYCCLTDRCCPEESSDEDESRESGLSAGAIAGIVIGSIALFLICICLICICYSMQESGRITQVKPVQQSGVSVISTGNQHNFANYGQHNGVQQPSAYDTNVGTSNPGYVPS